VKPQRLTFLIALVLRATLSQAGAAAFPPTTLSCDAFIKRQDGTWATRPVMKPFDIGDAKGVTLANIIIAKGLWVIGGVDVWELLNEKCGSKQTE
jgi:hypothetical protein